MRAPQRPKPPRWIEATLRVPLFWKIVLANGALVGGLAVAALLLEPAGGGAGAWPAVAWVAWAAGAVAVVSVNGLLVSVALRPIREIEQAARRVEAGDLGARVAPSPLADRALGRVIEVLNRMLEALEAARARQAELSARILEAEEGERRGISLELFDDTAQLLSATLLHLRLAARAFDVDRSDGSGHLRGRQALDAARSDVLAALSGIQRIARDLRPPELDELGPVAALENQARRLGQGRGPRIEIGGDAVDPWLSPATGLALYRILQEALSNAVVHSDATTIRIDFTAGEDRLEATLHDDGCGFDPAGIAPHPERHVGILRMYERARLAGGVAEITSRPGGGTRVWVSLPRRSEIAPGAAPRAGTGTAASLHGPNSRLTADASLTPPARPSPP